MRDDVRDALMIDSTTPSEARTIDITTTGRKSGEPRRIETVFRRVGDDIYLSGIPAPRPRAWLLNLVDNAHFIFHLKHGVVADLPARAEVITDPEQRRRIFAPMVEEYNRTRRPDGPFPVGVLDEWVQNSPLAKVVFQDSY